MRVLIRCSITLVFYLMSRHGWAADLIQCRDIFSNSALQLFDGRSFRSLANDVYDAVEDEDEEAAKSILLRVSNRFRELGYSTAITYVDGDDVVELVKAPQNSALGKLLNATTRRFGTRFYVSPFLSEEEDDSGYFVEEKDQIVIDLFEFKAGLLPNRVLLHEIRHQYFEFLKKQGKSHSFQGSLNANHRYKLERGDFYFDYLSLEELSTFYKEARSALTLYRMGSISRGQALSDLKSLKRVAKIFLRHSGKIRLPVQQEMKKWDAKSGWSIEYPIFKTSRNQVRGYLQIELPELNAKSTDEELNQVFQDKVAFLVGLAKEYLAYATAEISELTNK